MPSELKPCPFCGGRAILRKALVDTPRLKCDEMFVQCGKCGARSSRHYDIHRSIAEAGECAKNSWNTRFPPKKMSKKEIIQRNQEINKARKERLEKEKEKNEKSK